MVHNNKESIRSKVFEANGVPGMPGNTVMCKNVKQLLKHIYGTETDETRRAIEKAWNDHCVGDNDRAIIRKMPNSDEYRIIFGCDKSGRGSSVAAIYNPGHGPTESDPNGAAQLFKTVDLNAGEKVNKIDFDSKPAIDEVTTNPEEIEKQGAGLGGNNNNAALNGTGGSDDGSGSGDGSGDGSASSAGSGAGSGAGDGSGDGSESGDGSGDGETPGAGDGSGDGETPGEGETPETPGEGETPGDGETPPSDGNTSALVEFFTDPKVLIGVAVVGGIITTFAVLGKSIKARFRKTARSLYILQKDFGGSPEGLDMNNAFRGQGSRITDILVKVFGFGKKGKGAIGLVPFVKNYQDEIKRDYMSAAKSFNMISQAGKDQPGAEIHPQKESFNIPIYKSFREAYNARKLNESAYSGEEMNESVVATISSAMLLGKLIYSAGRFIWSKMGKDGKMEPAQAVQVTKQSTREVCYSIINCFFAKYFNMEGVSTKLGLDINHLSDIDKSNVDKFKKLVVSMKNEQNDNTRVSKMYSRVQKQYNEMLKRYFTIADKVVDNFETYSKKDKSGKNKQLSEKEQNLLTSGTEKLRMEISRQHDLYENNFFRVVNAIVASPEYIQYIDFIIENVLPVFETGNAGDADYVLNTMPRKNEYFLVRQTKNATEVPNPDIVDMRNGNVALIMVEEVTAGENGGAPIVKFKRIGLFKSIEGDAKVKIQEDGTVDYKTIDENKVKLDTKAYAKDVDGKEEGDSQSLEYTKWLAIDPIQVVNYKPKDDNNPTPADDSAAIGMHRQYNNSEELVFIIPVKDDSTNNPDVEQESEGRDAAEYQPDLAINEEGEEGTDQNNVKKVAKIEFVTKDNNNNDVLNAIIPQDTMSVEAVKNLLKGDKITTGKFEEIPADAIQGKKEETSGIPTNEIKDKTEEEIVDIINHKAEGGNNSNNSDLTKDKVAEALKQNVKTIADNISHVCKLDQSNFKLRQGVSGNEYNAKGVKLYRGPVTLIKTGVKTTKGNEIAVHTELFIPEIKDTSADQKIATAVKKGKVSLKDEYNDKTPIAIDNNGTVSVYKNNLKVRLYLVKLIDGKEVSDTNNVNGNTIIFQSNSEPGLLTNIKKGLEQLIISYTSEKSNIQENKEDVLESIKLEYTHSAVNESMTAVKLVRNAVFESNKNAYLVSMTCWGDGSRLNPAKFLEESVKSVVYAAASYYDIAKSAKKDKNLSILPLTESVTYQVPMPYNRYAILTNGNPLYEAAAVITVDTTPDHNITSSKFIGVTRIVK